MKPSNNISSLIIIAIIFGAIAYHNSNKKNTNIDEVPPKVVVPEIKEHGCDIALKKAVSDKRNLLIIFTAEWCGFCRTLKKDIESIDHKYELCVLDIDDVSNKDILKHFDVKKVPTSVLIDAINNKEIKRIEGYKKETYKNWIAR